MDALVRCLYTLAVVLVLGGLTGLWKPLESDHCTQCCSTKGDGDAHGDDCGTQGCPWCECCPTLRTTLPAETAVLSSAGPFEVVPVPSAAAPLSPEPREISHVPKRTFG